MPIPQEMKQFIGIAYDFNSSPKLGSESNTSTNCHGLVHKIYYARYGVILPLGMWSEEIYGDNSIFALASTDQMPCEGDIYIFGQTENQDPKTFHLAVFTGQYDQNGQPLLIHASAYNGRQVTVDPLDKFSQTPQHAALKAIKRLQPDIFNFHILPIIYSSNGVQ